MNYKYFLLSIFLVLTIRIFSINEESNKNKNEIISDIFENQSNYHLAEKRNIIKESHSDFDWKYYQEANNLKFKSEEEALKHYQSEGYFKKLKYCKSFTILILLYLNDVNNANLIIQKINKFITLNNLNNYHLKINIPINNKILTFNKFVKPSLPNNPIEEAKKITPYHKNLINNENAIKICQISNHFKENLYVPSEKVEVIFSENRGEHIGGFFILLNEVLSQNLHHDFIIKLHDHQNINLLTSFMNLKINKLLTYNDCIYSNNVNYEFKDNNINDKLSKLLKEYQFPKRNFEFCEGSIFICSSNFTKFFQEKKNNLINLFKQLESNSKKDDWISAYEKILGYLFNYLGFKKKLISHHLPLYPFDNKIYSKRTKEDINFIKKHINNFNIKVMAFYFPQFHEFEENNKLWGKGFTEWTLINNFKGEIKKPHVDIGQYNMLEHFTRKKQALIAKEHGIDAFCYYHYWFKDKPVMNAGLERMLEDHEPNIPYALCWANEPWTYNWCGYTDPKNFILIDQEYGNKDTWIRHYQYLLKYFKDPNYIKEDNCPILFIYRLIHLKDKNALNMLKLWKEMIKKDGFNDLKIISVLGSKNAFVDFIDGYAEHQPNFNKKDAKISFNHNSLLNIDIQSIYNSILKNPKISKYYIRGIYYSFNNSSRRINRLSEKHINLNYKSFEDLILGTIQNIAKNPNKSINFILLNSWNEWSEQAMIEPNDIDNYEILNIIKKIFR